METSEALALVQFQTEFLVGFIGLLFFYAMTRR